MKKDLTNKSNATAFDIVYRENANDYSLSNNYQMFAERMSAKYIMTHGQWEYLLNQFESKKGNNTDPNDTIQRLYLSNGSSVEVTTFENELQRSINVYEDDFINFTISKGKVAVEQYIFLGDTTECLKIWDAELAIEIYKNFEQHWNYLTKK